MGSEPGEKDPPKPNVFFSEPPMGNMNSMSMPMTTHFENMQPNYIGPNYLVNHGLINRNLQDDSMMSQGTNSMLSYGPGGNNLPGILPYYQGLFANLPGNKPSSSKPDDTINDMFKSAYKKYDVKKYLMQKLFGE